MRVRFSKAAFRPFERLSIRRRRWAWLKSIGVTDRDSDTEIAAKMARALGDDPKSRDRG